jgi:hypothetical protein
MRYVIALIAAGLIIGGVTFYIRQTDRSIEQAMRQALLRQQQAGTLPPEFQGVDLQSADLRQFGDFAIKLPEALEKRLQLTMFLSDYWYIWGPLTVILCLGAASLFGLVAKPEK